MTVRPIQLLAGSDLQSNRADIQSSINSAFTNWYFGTDGNPESNEVDLVSVVLHELAHGLGFSDSFNVNDADRGSWEFGSRPAIYDRFLGDGSGRNLIDTAIYPNPSMALGNTLSSNSVFFEGANTVSAVLFSPFDFQPESSIAHVDESTYYPASGNALMTPLLASEEREHGPGSLTQSILQDMGWGWLNEVVNHAPFADAGPGQQVNEQEVVTLNQAGGFDPDGDTLSFSWD